MNKKNRGVAFILIGILFLVSVGCGQKNEITGGKSIIDLAKEKGETVTDKATYLDDCKKSDAEMQDYCFGLGAIYYRDASFCKLIKNAETKKKCNQETIEKWYRDLENGVTPTVPTVPAVSIPGSVLPNYKCEKTDSASLCKKSMENGMLLACAREMSPEDKDSCYGIIALQLNNITLCDKISDSEKKEECKKSVEILNN